MKSPILHNELSPKPSSKNYNPQPLKVGWKMNLKLKHRNSPVTWRTKCLTNCDFLPISVAAATDSRLDNPLYNDSSNNRNTIPMSRKNLAQQLYEDEENQPTDEGQRLLLYDFHDTPRTSTIGPTYEGSWRLRGRAGSSSTVPSTRTAEE